MPPDTANTEIYEQYRQKVAKRNHNGVFAFTKGVCLAAGEVLSKGEYR